MYNNSTSNNNNNDNNNNSFVYSISMLQVFFSIAICIFFNSGQSYQKVGIMLIAFCGNSVI